VGDFRKLTAYVRSVELADELRNRVLTWPSFDRWSVGIQLVRSADSIGANIAEGSGRHSSRDEMRFLLIARGSALETEHWVDRALARGLLDDEHLRTAAREVGRLINGLLRAQRQMIGDW
jgi:four helix bundle protein